MTVRMVLLSAFWIGLVSTLVGCGSTRVPDHDDAKLMEGKSKNNKTATELKVVRSGQGILKGKITLEGGKPDLQALDAAMVAAMTKDPTQKPVCHDSAPDAERKQQDWRISDQGGLADVFVYLKPMKGSFFGFDPEASEVDKNRIEEAVKTGSVIDQPHCAFIPHAQKLWPSYRNLKNKEMKTGQELIVKNSSPIPHNFKIASFNDNINPLGKEEKKIPGITASYSLIPYGCSIHGWMTGNLLALDHPYVAITGADGSFEIKGVPAGKVLIFAVHGKAGFINANENKGEEIDLAEGENSKSFSFTAKSRQ